MSSSISVSEPSNAVAADMQLDEAKRILAEHGYSISPKPIEWHEFNILVTIKVQSRVYTQTDFRRFVEDILVADAPRLAIHSGKEILATHAPVIKEYNKPIPEKP